MPTPTTTNAVIPPGVTIPPRSRLYHEPDTTPPPRPKRKTQPLFFVCIGMVLFIGGYLCLTIWVIPFFQGLSNHWQYGKDGISQFDFNVGHGGISHFIAEDQHGTIVVIEIVEVGNYPYHVYTSHIYASDTSQRIVTLSLTDANHDSKPDLEVTVSGETIPLILYNTGTAFSLSEG